MGRQLVVGNETPVSHLVLLEREDPHLVDVWVQGLDVPDRLRVLEPLPLLFEAVPGHPEFQDEPVVRCRRVGVLAQESGFRFPDHAIGIETAGIPDAVQVRCKLRVLPEVEVKVGRVGGVLDGVRGVDDVEVHPPLEDLLLDPFEVHQRRISAGVSVLIEKEGKSLLHLDVHRVIEELEPRVDQMDRVVQVDLGLLLEEVLVVPQVLLRDPVVHHRDPADDPDDQEHYEDEQGLRERTGAERESHDDPRDGRTNPTQKSLSE
ncbi:hypothetical protein DSECCO2_592240 [anaerobic digester metagenome]